MTTRRIRAAARRAAAPTRRVVVAHALVIGGRVYLGALAVALVLCASTRDVWGPSSPPDEISSHWIPQTAFACLMVFMVAWVFLLLPVSSYALVRSHGGFLIGETVLGRRRIDVATARWSRITLPGKGYSSFVLCLRDARWRVLFIVGTGAWHGNHFEDVAGHTFRGIDTANRAVLRYMGGIAVLVVGVCGGLAAMFVAGFGIGLFD